jgi:urease accessory protein
MHVADPVHLRSWHAELALRYQRRGERTVLAERRHDGPLVVQKPLYPEGDAVCHTIILHPPAGIVGGDELEISCDAAADAQVLLTTPGAGKWYRSAGPWAKQRLSFKVATGACLEWLPQETIVFDGALADMGSQINLSSGATYIGWEILCLGRAGSGERYEHGTCRLHTEIRRDGKLLWWPQRMCHHDRRRQYRCCAGRAVPGTNRGRRQHRHDPAARALAGGKAYR